MLNIVIISAVYPPEPVVSARMSQDLAEYLNRKNAEVTVLCPYPSRIVSGVINANQNKNEIVVSYEHGVKIARLHSYTAPQSNIFHRIRESFSFGKNVKNYLTNQSQQPDLLYVNSWPMLSQAIIARYAEKNKIPMILQIMDVYPEALLNRLPGVIQKTLVLPLTLLDMWIVKKSSCLTVISENMSKLYAQSRKITPERIKIINVWHDENMYMQLPERMKGFLKYNVPSDLFTFLYLGNIGPVAGVDFLIQAFCKAKLNNSQLIIVGEGSEKDRCIETAERIKARNVLFLSDPNPANVPILQSMADVCLLPMKKGAGISSIPSKLAAYMFSAKPVISTVDSGSDIADTIQLANCGWAGPPEDLHWLADKMREVSVMENEVMKKIGMCGREFAFENFSKAKRLEQFANIIGL